jgi:hypothetical protein
MKFWPMTWFAKHEHSPTKNWKVSGPLYSRLQPEDLEPIASSRELPEQYAEFRHATDSHRFR